MVSYLFQFLFVISLSKNARRNIASEYFGKEYRTKWATCISWLTFRRHLLAANQIALVGHQDDGFRNGFSGFAQLKQQVHANLETATIGGRVHDQVGVCLCGNRPVEHCLDEVVTPRLGRCATLVGQEQKRGLWATVAPDCRTIPGRH